MGLEFQNITLPTVFFYQISVKLFAHIGYLGGIQAVAFLGNKAMF